MLLKIQNLRVSIGGKEILHGIDMEIPKGETHVLFGPNGSGKTTLIKTVMGFPDHEITKGEIRLDDSVLNDTPINERAKKGVGVAFQEPPEIRGVKLGNLLRILGGRPEELVRKTNLDKAFLDRELNVGFSGGEKKRVEMAQMFALRPGLLVLDEPDSGVDVDSLKLLGDEVSRYVKETGASVLVVTHTGHILRHLKPKKAHVIINGKNACSGKPRFIWKQITEKGYGWCLKCLKPECG